MDYLWKVSLIDLKFRAFHGVFPQEKKCGNDFTVNLEVEFNSLQSSPEDNLDSTISYADLYQIINREMKIPNDLLETVAWNINNAILQKWPFVTKGYCEIIKENPPIEGCIGSAGVKLVFQK